MKAYPQAKQVCYEENHFGTVLSDPFIGLENPTSEETLAWVKEENAYTDRYFKDEQIPVQQRIERLKRQKGNEVSYNNYSEAGSFVYASKYLANGTIELVRMDPDGQHETVMATNATFDDAFMIFSLQMSVQDNGIGFVHALAHGADRPSVLVYDFHKQRLIRRLDGIFSCTWTADGTEIIYSDVEVDVKRQVNTNMIKGYRVDDDTIVTYYTHEENAVMIDVSASEDGRWIIGMVEVDYSNSEVILIERASKTVRSLTNHQVGEYSYLTSLEDVHYFISRRNAPMGALIAVRDTMDDATTVIPENKDMLVEGQWFQGRFYVHYMKDVASDLRVYDVNGTYERSVSFPDRYGCVGFAGKSDRHLYISYESFIQSPSIYVLEEETVRLWFEQRIGHVENITVEQVFVPSHDGVNIPAFIIRPNELAMTKDHPTIMYGYGGYNIAMPPTFNNPFIGMDIIDWVGQGYVYVHCNLRGGNEYGTSWHEAGYLKQKKNCFYDFIAIAEWLIEQGYTNPKRIAITGGSNGGLLMTALTTMRPDLFGCVIASVPHTDMIHFVNDDRGPMYITEYGNPKEEDMFAYMLSYSPYHNIRECEYPAMYIQTGECDNNVPPYHGKKFAAKMQTMNQSDQPILLRVLKEGSHDRGKGDVYFQTIAEMQAFIAHHITK